MFNHVFVFHGGSGLTAATTALGLIIRQRLRLGITRARNRDHHILFSDQIFNREIQMAGLNFRTTIIAKLVTHRSQLFANHFH